jgi:hypothetical protein
VNVAAAVLLAERRIFNELLGKSTVDELLQRKNVKVPSRSRNDERFVSIPEETGSTFRRANSARQRLFEAVPAARGCGE